MDVVFVFSSAGVNASTLFEKEKYIAQLLTKEYTVSPNAVNIGAIIDANSGPRIAVKLEPYATSENIQSKLSNINYEGESKDIAQAVEFVKDKVFDKQSNKRKNVPKTMVIFFNKIDQEVDKIKTAVTKLKNDNEVTLVAVPVGKDSDINIIVEILGEKDSIVTIDVELPDEQKKNKVKDLSRKTYPGKFTFISFLC